MLKSLKKRMSLLNCLILGAMVRTIINQQQLSRNRQAMGVASIDSTEIVTRLRLHVAIVSGQCCHCIKLNIKLPAAM